ncbi:MAG TPA: transposase [Candidatus Kapabacteria bacterium]|nr:transposase [Candidatus Kapabacteria bacterium]
MRSVRITYEGARHHVICRGKKGKDIFLLNRNKLALLDLLKENASRYKIRIFAYCIMDNEYHLICENTSGKMSGFLKHINGQYGMYSRKSIGDKGPVFHDRFKSILIQDEAHLKMAIGYVLLIPVREKIVDTVDEYLWSSIGDYFVKKKPDLVDSGFVNELFGSKKQFYQYLRSEVGEELPILKTRNGMALGNSTFLTGALKINRERINAEKNAKPLSAKDGAKYFEPVEKIIREFEDQHQVKIGELNTGKYEGKRLRAELLIHLKDRAGLTYPEIIKIPLFKGLKAGSLGRLYQGAKERLKQSPKEKTPRRGLGNKKIA